MPIPIQCYESISTRLTDVDVMASNTIIDEWATRKMPQPAVYEEVRLRHDCALSWHNYVIHEWCQFEHVSALNWQPWQQAGVLMYWCRYVLLMSMASAFWTDCRPCTRRWHTTTITSTKCDWIRYKCNFSLCNAMPETWVLRPLGHFNFWLSLRSKTWRWMLKSGLRPKFNLTSV